MVKRTEPDLGFISIVNRMDRESFAQLLAKLLEHLGLEVVSSHFEDNSGYIEARVKGDIKDSVYPYYHILVSRKKDMVEPEDLQDIISLKENENEGLIFFTTSGFSDNARVYANEFNIDIVDYEILGSMLRKFGIFKEIMAQRDRDILREEKGRYLPSIEKLENIIEAGNKAFAKRNYYDALNYFSRATDLKPNYDTAWYMKGVIYNNMKKPNEALEAFMKALESNIENEKAWYSMGLVLFSLGRYDEELECYDKALKIKKDFLSAWNNKGTTLLQLERFQEAIECYDEILRYDSNFKMAWNNRGIALKKLRRTDEALECFSKAVQIDPNYMDAWFNKGQIHLDAKQYKKAYHCFEAILKIDPNNIQVLYGKAKALEGAGQYSKAILCYDRIIDLDFRFYAAKRRKKKAQRYLEQKGDSQVDDDFFKIALDEESIMFPRKAEERILVKKTKTPSISPPKEMPPESEQKAITEPPAVHEQSTLPPKEIISEQAQMKLESEAKALTEMKEKLLKKEQELTQMESWLSEKYEAYEKERREKDLTEEAETLAKERESLQKDKDILAYEREELSSQAKAIAKAKAAMTEKERSVFYKEEEIKRRFYEMEKKAHGMAQSERNVLALGENLRKEKEELESEKGVMEREKIRLIDQTKGIAKAKQNLIERENRLTKKEEELMKRYNDMDKNAQIIAQKEKELEEAAIKIKKRQDELELQFKILRDKERSVQEDVRLRRTQADEEQMAELGAEITVSRKEEEMQEISTFPGEITEPAEPKELEFEPEIEGVEEIELKGLEKEIITKKEALHPYIIGEALHDREALALFSLRNFQGAENKIDELASQGLESKLSWNMMGDIKQNKNDPEVALSCYEKAFKLDQNYILTLTNLMSICWQLDRIEEAYNYCERILAQRGDDEKYIFEKALLEGRLGRFDDAVSTIDNLLRLNDNLEVAWNVRGILMHNLNRTDYAILCFEKALKINPRFKAALNNKGAVLYHKNNIEEALMCFNLALEIGHDDGISKNKELTLKKRGMLEKERPKEMEKETDFVARIVGDMVRPTETEEKKVTEIEDMEETEVKPIPGTFEDLLDLGGKEEEVREEKKDKETSLFMCPSCGSFVSESANICPSCSYDFVIDEDELIEEAEEIEEIDKMERVAGEAKSEKKVGIEERSKEEIIKELMNISGIGLSKAGALYDAGFRSISDLTVASISELAEVKGIGRTLAKIIKKRLEGKKPQGG